MFSVILNLYMLSRADERFGFMTPQQPIWLGANTDKVDSTLADDYFIIIIRSLCAMRRDFFLGTYIEGVII